jgi:hypothetical protein
MLQSGYFIHLFMALTQFNALVPVDTGERFTTNFAQGPLRRAALAMPLAAHQSTLVRRLACFLSASRLLCHAVPLLVWNIVIIVLTSWSRLAVLIEPRPHAPIETLNYEFPATHSCGLAKGFQRAVFAVIYEFQIKIGNVAGQ